MRLPPSAPGASPAGFSMVELLVSIAITSVVMGSVLLVASQMRQSYYTHLDGAGVQQEARYALDWISAELTAAGSNPSNVSVSSCPANGTAFRAIRRDPNGNGVQDDVRVHADINPPNGLLGGGAGACSEAGEDVTIAHDAVNRRITRRDNNLDAAPVAMSDSVITQLRFTYLTAARAAATTDDAVAYIGIAVTAQTPRPDPYTGQPVTFTLTSEVRVRTR